MDSQSRRSSRDASLDRYEEQRSKDRNTSSLHNSRDTSPSSEHNSYRSESHRYRSSRDDKYSSRGDRYMDDSKGEGKDFEILPTHSHRSSRMGSPQYMNSNSMHSHDSDYGARRGSRGGSHGSRSQSPDVTLLNDPYSSSGRSIFYPEDYKRSVVTDDDLDSPYPSSKRRESLLDSSSSKSRSLALLSNKTLGAEVAKTAAEKGRKRTHEETLASNASGVDSKLFRKLDKSSPLSGSEREKTRHVLKRRSGGGTVGSPGGLSSGGSQGGGSENGLAGEDLRLLRQRQQQLLMEIEELDDPVTGAPQLGGTGTTSDSDSPQLVKSVAVKDGLRRSGRSHEGGNKVDEDCSLSRLDKLRRSSDNRRLDSRGPFYSPREDRTLGFDEETSLGGIPSDSDYDSEKQRSKKRRLDTESVKSKDYHRQGSVELSDSEDFEKKSDINARLDSSTLEGRAGCDIRSNSLGSKHLFEDKSMDMSASPCDNSDPFKDQLSDKDILVINKHRNSSKSNTSYLSRKDWKNDLGGVQEASPAGSFSPALSDRGEDQDSVVSSSLTEKSSKHPSSPPAWKCSPSASPVPKDNDSEPDLSYLNNYNTDPLDDDDLDDDCLSDSSLVGGESLPGPGPGEASWEERIRAIDRVLNMAPCSKAGPDFSLVGGSSSSSSSLCGSKDAANNNDACASANRYAKYRIRKREEGGAGVVDITGSGGDNGSVPEQPSVIVQRVMSKKSILDQDFKRLEQVNKYDANSSGILGSTGGVNCGILKDLPQLLLPSSSSSSLTVVKEEPLASPRLMSANLVPPVPSSALSPALSPSLNPVTTSSSLLQPTMTTSLAGSALSSASSISLPPASITSALGSSTRALTTSSVCTPISSISVSHENSGSKDVMDKNIKTSVVNTNSSFSSSSRLVASQSNLLSVPSISLSLSTLSTVTTQHTSLVSSSSPSISVSVTSSTSHTVNVQHTSSTASSLSSVSLLSSSSLLSTSVSSSSLQSKPVISSLPLPPSLLSSVALSVTTTATSTMRSASMVQPSHPASSTSSPSPAPSRSSSQQPTSSEPASGGGHTAPAAAPFTQGPSTKSQLVPTLGQEAPLLTSSVFDPQVRESSTIASASCPRLPEDTGLLKASSGQTLEEKEEQEFSSSSSSSSTAQTTNRSNGNTELTINLWGSKAGQTASTCEDNNSSNKFSKSKPEVVTPDIESPVSVKSGTSSTDSVPLSSLDTKPCISVTEERSSNLTAAENCGLSLKVEPVSPTGKGSDSALKENRSDCEDSMNKDNTISNILVPKKSEVSVPVTATQATVLTVSSKDCPEKEEKLSSSDLGQIAKGKMDTLSPSSSASMAVMADEDGANSALQTPKPSSSSSSSTTTTAPTTSVSSSRLSIEKSEKKTPSKPSSKAATSGRTEALFAPDVKLEPPQQKSSSSSSSRDSSKHKDSHKGSSQSGSSKPSSSSSGSSSTNDKKSLKNQSSKDSSHGEKRDSSTSSSTRDNEKSEKKSDASHKTHDATSTSKAKDGDKSKIKDKRDQSKEGDKGGRKDKDDAKRKEDKKPSDKKEEKKGNAGKEEKKNDKKLEEKKEKTSAKQDTLKHSKSDQDLNKKEKDKKAKEKTKESGGKDKVDKKLLPGLSCVSKHSASPEPKSDAKSSKSSENKPGNKESTSKSEKEKAEMTSSKVDSKMPLKQDVKHKSEQKSGSKLSDSKSETKEAQAKKSSSDSTQKMKKESDKSNLDASQKSKKEEEKQGSDSVSKGKKELEKLGSDSVLKAKKEGEKEKDAAKQSSSSKHSDKAQRQKQKEEERLKEKQRIREQREREEKERKEKEEKEKQREREEKEKQKEKEREEKERQKEKEREEKERQKAEKERKEKEEKERKEREEKERLKREKEERERQKEKEREERERQKEKEREEKERKEKEEKERIKKEKEEKEKAKQKEREEKERIEKEKRESEEKERLKKEKERKEKKEKEKKKAKEEKLKKEKEAKAKKEKEEKQKKEREEKEKAKKEKDKKEKDKDKDKEKEDKDDKKKPPPPKKQKRNELAALLDSNDRFQMTFTSMYDRVKTQRNRDADPMQPNKSPSSASQRSSDKHKKKNKKGKKSAVYYSTSDLSDDDNLSETNDSEDQQSHKADLSGKETKSKKTKQVKKRPHLSSSSSSSSSCEDDDDALLSATKPKGGKKTDIFSSDSEDDSFPPPVKSSKGSKSKTKPPAPKKKKVRADSLDSVESKEEFVKPQLLSSVTETESLDDMDLSETEPPKVTKIKKKKGKLAEKRDSSVESVTKEPVSKKSSKADRDSSAESVVRKPVKSEKDTKTSNDKECSPSKKVKTDSKKNKHTEEKEKSVGKEDVKLGSEDKKMDQSEDDHVQRKADVKKEQETDKESVKTDSDKHKSKDKPSAEKISSENKSSSEKKKKKEREDGTIKKKKKKKYDPKEELESVNSLITKVYDKAIKKKKPIQSLFEIESDDHSLSETSLDVSQDKKSSLFGKEESGNVKQKEKKPDPLFDTEEDIVPEEKPQKQKPTSETTNKQEVVDKKPEPQTKKDDHVDKKKEHVDKKPEAQDKKESKNKVKAEETVKPEAKAEPESERSESGKPPKKKKKKDHDRDAEREKGGKSGKSSKNLTSPEKKSSDSHKGDEEKKTPEAKTSQKDVDEFTSFWGHPKPILIPKRLKDSKKSEDDSSKSKDQKDDAKADKGKGSEDDKKIKEEAQDKTDKTEEEKQLDSPSVKTPESVATPKVESDAGEDFVVPISEAETTVVTENGQPASSESVSTSDSLVINEEQTAESADDVTGDMTAIGSSVEINDDDDFPSLIIDEVSESVNESKKKTKKDKKQLKKQKDINDRLDEVIASVAMGGSSDEDDALRQSPDVNLQDVIDEELKYDNKSSNEPERKAFIVSDFVFPDDKRKSELGPSFLRDKAESKSAPETTKKEPEKKAFLPDDDEETKKRDAYFLEKLASLCDGSVNKPVEIEDPKVKEEERKKKEEEEKKKAEEEKKKAEEEKKKAEEAEKEEKARREREASDEAARAVECLLEFQEVQSGGFDDDLPPLFIEPAEKEPPVESVSMSPSKEKSDVSIFPGSIPEKVTTNLDDKLLERKSSGGESGDSLGLFATPSQNTHVPVFTSPRRNSIGVSKDKTPEPVTMPSPQRQMRSPQRQQPPLQQSPQLHSPQQRPMQSPQQGPPLHSSPQKIQSPQTAFMQSPQQKPLHSPQQHHPQSPSPQRPNQSPHRVGLQSPLLSPQRSPFFKDRSFISPGRDALAAFPQHDVDSMPLVQQPQRRASSGVPVPPTPEHALDPQVARRKSQEFPVEQALHSPRRNTIAAPEEAATSVTHLDRRFSHGHQGSAGSGGVFLSKERSHSSLPQPVSISLDNAPHDKNYHSPVRSLTNLPHQENVLLSPKRGSPGFHQKEQHSLDQPGPFHLFQNKTSVPEQIFSGGPITSMANQMFSPGQQSKVLSQQDPGLAGGKGVLLDKGGFKQAKGHAEQQVFRAGVMDKPVSTLNKDPLFLHQKGLHQEPPLFQQGKDMHHQMQPEPFGLSHNKPSGQVSSQPHQEPMFSPKTQPNSPYTYPDMGYDFLNSPPPPKIGSGVGNYPLPSSEASQLNPIKPPPVSVTSEPFSQDPLFIAMSEASARPPPEQAPVPRRQDGLPPSFYQEPVPKPAFPPEMSNMQPQFEDEKKGAGTRKRRKSSKKLPKEGKEAALAEQAIQEIVHTKLELIHQAHNAKQAKAAAEKAGSKKPVDAYDFEAHTGQESGDIPSRSAMSDLHHVGLSDGDTTKPLRMRNEGRGRGRGRGAGRGRRGRGGAGANANVAPMSALQEKHQDPFHKSLHGPDQFNNQRRPGTDFAGQQQQHPPIHSLDHHMQPHHEPSRLGGMPGPYHAPVSHHGAFPPSVSQPSPFSRQVPPQQVGGPPLQPGFPQSFYQPPQSPAEGSGSGGLGLQEMPPKQPHQQSVPGIPTSSNFQHLPPPPVSAAVAALPPVSQQPQQQPVLQLPQAGKASQQGPLKTSGGSDVLSPESNKQQHDLDSSYGESELVINLDDQPPSIEGKENQYSLSSDSEDRSSSSMAPSPATPRSQRATRTRKQPNYKAIAAGTAQQQAQGSSAVPPSPGPPGRASRSGGSPRGLRAAGSSGPPASPKSPRAASSSPVVKLEKIEVGGVRTTRRGRAGMAGGKEDLSSQGEDISSNGMTNAQPNDDWKTRLGDQQGADKPASVAKDSIYDFADNESDQQRDLPTSLRPNQRRNKKRVGVSSALEPPDTGIDFMPASPASSSNSSSIQPEQQKPGNFDSITTSNFAGKADDETTTGNKGASSSLLSNMDAVIEAVAKGRFGDEEESEDTALLATPASNADPGKNLVCMKILCRFLQDMQLVGRSKA